MSSGSTRAPIAATFPRFAVEGQENRALGQDLLELEVVHDEHGLSRLEAVVLNWGSPEGGGEPDFRWFGGDTLQLGKQIKVTVGEEDSEALVFQGAITALRAVYVENQQPQLIILAEDAGQQLRMVTRTRVFESQSDKDLASQVAQDHGLSPEGDVTGPTHVQLWQVNQSDLSFLRERARAVDARLGMGERTLGFSPRRPSSPPEPLQLSRLNELLRFEVSADLAHQRTEVKVHGWSVTDKDGIHGSATSSEVDAEKNGGTTGPAVLQQLGWTAVDHHHLEQPATEDEARTLAKALMLERARRFVSGKGITSGTPSMRVGSVLELSDLGAWFSGKYTAVVVVHSWDQQNGLRTRFVAERVDLGSGS